MGNKYKKYYFLLFMLLHHLFGFWGTSVWGQHTFKEKTEEISGHVCDKDGEKLPGAIVTWWKDGKIREQTLSDENGRFILSATPQATAGSFLSIRFLGYTEKKIYLSAGKRNYIARLTENSEQLGEVVVTGFINRSKHSYTGSMSSISKEQLQKQVQTNLIKILKQEIPGFELTEDIVSGSDPNKIPDMILRGRSTFAEGDRTYVPLFVLDGVEVDVTTIFNLRAELIEQVTVLKDAAATSFYGAKAANGVVVVTTVPPKEGKIQTDYTANLQLSVPDLSGYRLLSAGEKLEYEKLAGIYGSFSGKDKTDIERQKSYFSKLNRVTAGVDTKWMNLPLRTGVNHSHTLAFTGGTRQIRYNLTGGYNEITGIMQHSSRQSGTLRVHLSYGNMDKLLVQYITWFTFSQQNDVPYGSFRDYTALNPYDSPYLPDGSLNRILSFNKANPLYEKSLNSYIRRSSSQFAATLRVRSCLSPQWRVEGMCSLLYDKGGSVSFYSPLSARFVFNEASKRGSFDVSDTRQYDYQGNIFVVYNTQFGQNSAHTALFTAGGNIQASGSDTHGFSAVGVLSDKIDHESLASGYAEGAHPLGGRGESRLLGMYLSASYVFDNRYFAEGSFRYEGSSKFGTDNKFAPFGSLSAGWNVHKEKFMRSIPLGLLKLRISAGYVGNTGFTPYQARLAYRYHGRYVYNNQVGAMPLGMFNPGLKWERTLKYNAGFDFSLFDDRLSGSFDCYDNITGNLVVTMAKPPHLGFKEAKENLGKIRNTGIELSLRGRIYSGNNGGINAYISAAHNRNRIIQISDYLKNKNKQAEEKGNSRLPAYLYEEGESMTALKVFESAGINPANGKEVFIRHNGEYTYRHDYRDKRTVGDTAPVLSGTIGLTWTWKRLSASASFIYRLGATLYNQTLATKVEGSDPMENADLRVFHERWKHPGDKAKYKHIGVREYTPPTSRFVKKEYALEGNSFTVSYVFPPMFARCLRVRHVQASLSTGNFLYLSTIKRERGLDYPFNRIYQFALTINI